MKILRVPHLYTPTSLHRNVFSLVGIHPDFFCSFTYKIWVLNEYINWNIHWKDWCWSWNSSTLATSCKKPTHWESPWCWERLKAGKGGDRAWDGWMASLTQWTWLWASSGSWWWTGKPGMLQSMRSQRVGHDWETEQQEQ